VGKLADLERASVAGRMARDHRLWIS